MTCEVPYADGENVVGGGPKEMLDLFQLLVQSLQLGRPGTDINGATEESYLRSAVIFQEFFGNLTYQLRQPSSLRQLA